MSGKLVCFGFGYCAHHLAARLLAENVEIVGTSREPGKRAMAGVELVPFGPDHPLPDAIFEGATHILTSVPPNEVGDPVLQTHLHQLQTAPLSWVGYLGTTAVYGDRQGEWVDEDAEVRPTLARAQRRADAERAWLDSGLPVHIFRLAGIYGPGRNPLDNVKNGKARRIVKPGQVFSRIHVDDIATVLQASMAMPNPGRIYNVCDDEPAPPQDVVSHAATLLGIEPPPEQSYETADLSPMARTFYADNRRVSNRRIKEELGVTLAHPNYREGLKALLAR